VLYPFVPPAGTGEPLLVSLGSLFGGSASFGFTLDRVGWFGEGVVWLGPRDPAPFSTLTTLVFTAFPACSRLVILPLWIEELAHLAGHSTTRKTAIVYARRADGHSHGCAGHGSDHGPLASTGGIGRNASARPAEPR
jgi:hypothetical protein